MNKHAPRTVAADGPHPVDIAVGRAARLRRKALGLSQEAVAEALGITFQQVQKYERGANRISASRLYDMAVFLKAPVEHFFRECESGGGEAFQKSVSERGIHDFLGTREGIELAQAFPLVRTPAIRRRLLELVRTLADD